MSMSPLSAGRAAWAATILRVCLGAMFLVHGLVKLLIITPAGVYAMFTVLGLPGVLGYATMAGEIAIGLGLVLGVATRLAALAGTAILLGAIVTVHAAKGFSAGQGGWEFAAFWAVALIVQVMLGEGRLALGHFLRSHLDLTLTSHPSAHA